MSDVLTQLFATALGSGGTVWVVMRVQLLHLQKQVDDVKDEIVRAHIRIDKMLDN